MTDWNPQGRLPLTTTHSNPLQVSNRKALAHTLLSEIAIQTVDDPNVCVSYRVMLLFEGALHFATLILARFERRRPFRIRHSLGRLKRLQFR